MFKRIFAFLFVTSICMIGLGSCSDIVRSPKLTRMKCEFVPDGDTAVIYGKYLSGAEVFFPGGSSAVPLKGSDDTMLIVKVPKGSEAGFLKVCTKGGCVESRFCFRDFRNPIIDFEMRLPTWGGYDPFDENGEKVRGIVDENHKVKKLKAGLPDPCSGTYGFILGNYDKSWTMPQSMYIQYCASPDEGGRGNISVAGVSFQDYALDKLALKFEVYIPKDVPFVGPKTEIYFGPIDAENKHGREVSTIAYWKPYEKKKTPYYTNGWETISIPLTEFKHGIESEEKQSKFVLDLHKATNFSFVIFGEANSSDVFMCVDNFRIVPL